MFRLLHMKLSARGQVRLATFMCIFGCMLITAGFIVNPAGYIDPTVLTAFGEILTFAGAVIGVDYSYRRGPRKHDSEEEEKE